MNTDETVAGHDPGERAHLWWRRKPVLAMAVVVLVAVGVLVGIAVHSAGQYFVFAPGTAPLVTASSNCKPHGGELALPDGTPCVRLVVPRSKVHAVSGRLLMVDVEVSQASPLDWAEYKLGLLGSQRQLVNVVAYAGDTPTSELGCQDTQQMVSANQDAAMAALRALHYPVREKQLGAQIEAVLSGTPAWNAGIKCNDVITAVDGKPVNSATQFVTLLRRLSPGTTVTLTDHRNGAKTAEQVKVRLATPPPGLASRAYLGVAVQTMVEPKLPFHVSVNAGGIGGPSAGLAFTLAILDTLTAGDLTGGHTVAATGTISPDGQVGPVGGVQQKTIAVEKAGAQVFFVPAAEYGQAKPVASKRLQVVPVSTLQQALQVLKDRYGGHVPE
jgi:PDZ domain-containing secreted protein